MSAKRRRCATTPTPLLQAEGSFPKIGIGCEPMRELSHHLSNDRE
jgi:hypothetical protein